MIVILNLSTPKKILLAKFKNSIFNKKCSKYSLKKSTPVIAASIAAILKPEQVAAKTMDAQNCNFTSFLGSLVLPLAESYKYRHEIKFFMKYTLMKFKNSN